MNKETKYTYGDGILTTYEGSKNIDYFYETEEELNNLINKVIENDTK